MKNKAWIVVLVLFVSSQLMGDPNNVINFSATLQDQGGYVKGSNETRFEIYSAEAPSDIIWTETLDVPYYTGFFTQELGHQSTLTPDLFYIKDPMLRVVVSDASEEYPITPVPCSILAKEAIIAKSVDWENIKNKPEDKKLQDLSGALKIEQLEDELITDAKIKSISASKISGLESFNFSLDINDDVPDGLVKSTLFNKSINNLSGAMYKASADNGKICVVMKAYKSNEGTGVVDIGSQMNPAVQRATTRLLHNDEPYLAFSEAGISISQPVIFSESLSGNGQGLTNINANYITQGTLSAERIAEGSITNEKLAGNIDGSKIIGTIQASIQDASVLNNHINPNASISFSKLNITKSDITGLGIPAENTDTNTQLSQIDVATYATNEGFIKTSGVLNGDVLYYKDGWQRLAISSAGKMLKISATGYPEWSEGVTSLVGMDDTNISNQADNEVLSWDSASSKWINQTASGAGLSQAGHNHDSSYFTEFEISATGGTASQSGAYKIGAHSATITGTTSGTLQDVLEDFGDLINSKQASNTILDDLADGSLSGAKVGSGINASNITSGTLPDAQLSNNVSKLGDSISNAEIFDVDWSKVSSKPSIAYADTIAAGDFSQTEVANLRTAKLNDGTTPWTSKQNSDADLDDLADGSLSGSKINGSINVAGTVIAQSGLGTESGGPVYKFKEIEIGAWNLNGTTPEKEVSHGLGSNWSKVRTIHVTIINDNETKIYDPFQQQNSSGQGIEERVFTAHITSTKVFLRRENNSRSNTSFFQSADFDDSSLNRGYVLLKYRAN